MIASAPAVGTDRERILSLQGGCNFRDIGGYRTEQGATTRWGQVYRTGVLTYFTPEDHATLLKLQVRSICDLRRAEERNHEPTRWPDANARGLFWDDGHEPPKIRHIAAQLPKNASGMFDAMIALYRVLPEWMGPRIQGMFEAIASGHVPLIVHCAAGKDRTGVAVAVLLRSLGVPEETVLEDYLLTNDAGDFETFIRAKHEAQLGLGDNHGTLLAMPEEMRRVLFRAEREFLHTALEQIERKHGGFEQYLATVVKISDETRQRVRSALLE